MSAGFATLNELDTLYGVEDLYDMIEIMRVDTHNRRLVQEAARKRDAG